MKKIEEEELLQNWRGLLRGKAAEDVLSRQAIADGLGLSKSTVDAAMSPSGTGTTFATAKTIANYLKVNILKRNEGRGA